MVEQNTIPTIRESILKAARTEFTRAGYKGASLRKIAQEVGIVVSNIYNYYESKDDLFRAVLQPLLSDIDRMLYRHNDEEFLTLSVFTDESYQDKMMEDSLTIVRKHRDILHLALFQSGGSSLENYRNDLIRRQAQIGEEYLRLMKQRFPNLRVDVSPFFVHVQSAWWVTIMGEIAFHQDLTDEEITRSLQEFTLYGTGGWKALLNA